MDSYLNFFLDRIYRMNRIFSRFPDETVKFAPALQRKNYNYAAKNLYSAKRVAYYRFHPEAGNEKNPVNPVNPVYCF